MSICVHFASHGQTFADDYWSVYTYLEHLLGFASQALWLNVNNDTCLLAWQQIALACLVR